MITHIDDLLDRITIYRLVLYVLIGLLILALALSSLHILPFSPLALLLSADFLLLICWGTNWILARIFAVPTNIESAYITALILALILDPFRSPADLPQLGWAAILAMASKYILSFHNKHVFNPAAISVVITSFAIGESINWWVSTASMLPAVLFGGILLLRRLRQGEMVIFFVATALITTCIASFLRDLPVARELQQLLIASPLFFFATIMLTEPLTTPPTRNLQRLYGLITGILFVPQIHFGPIYSTPELALVIANIYSYLVSPKQKVALTLRNKAQITPDIVDFAFRSSENLIFEPGQYMEFTLAHRRPDSRGNRRFFTLASSPTEEYLHVGVRFHASSSSFKTALYTLDNTTTVLAGQIAGDFTLPQDPQEKLVFIAGGIGITPFRSMLKYLLDTRQQRDIILFYSNTTADEIAYNDILSEAQAKLGISVFYTLTNRATLPHDWKGFVGRIDERVLQRTVPDYQERTYYISGLPDMARDYEHILKNIGVPASQIKTDFYPGFV